MVHWKDNKKLYLRKLSYNLFFGGDEVGGGSLGMVRVWGGWGSWYGGKETVDRVLFRGQRQKRFSFSAKTNSLVALFLKRL